MKAKFSSLIAILIGCAFVALAVDVSRMPYHRFRKVGDKYYDLQPVYDWIKLGGLSKDPMSKDPKSKLRPMPEWIGGSYANLHFSGSYEVSQVLPYGLLVESKMSVYRTDKDFGGRLSFLTNYPYLQQVLDGQRIEFLAIRAGVFQYEGTSGAMQTVPMLDYGVPYDPWKLQKEKQASDPAGTAKPKP